MGLYCRCYRSRFPSTSFDTGPPGAVLPVPASASWRQARKPLTRALPQPPPGVPGVPGPRAAPAATMTSVMPGHETEGGRRWHWRSSGCTWRGGAVLVDTGVGGPERLLADWRVVNRSAADALAELDMTPADIGLVINTHLHFDHCGQNAVFRHAACYVQRSELDRAKRESPDLYDWFDFMNARFELLDN